MIGGISGCAVKEKEVKDGPELVRQEEVAAQAPGGKLRVLSGWPEAALGIQELRGQVLLLDFMATWSAPARSQVSGLGALHDQYKGRNFQVLGMLLDRGDQAGLESQADALNVPYPLLQSDEESLMRFGGVRSIPTRILVDRKGEVRYRYTGITDLNLIRADIEKLVAE